MNTPGLSRKGRERREAIVHAALAVFSEHGYDDTTIARVAATAGLTTSGVMHYFSSKDDLFTAVLRQRQDGWRAEPARFRDGASVLLDGVPLNEERRGTVSLYTTMLVQSIEPGSDAHDFFVDHLQSLIALVSAGLAERRDRGELLAEVDADALARVLVAASDGLQIQWLLDPTVPLAADIAHLTALLSRPAKNRLSVQLYSVRDALAADLPATLRRVREAGFEQVELFRPVELRAEYIRALADAELTVSSVHAHLVGVEQEPVFAAAAALHAGTVVDPRIDRTRWSTRDDVLRSADELNRTAEAAAGWGLRVGYHNHDVELSSVVDGRPALEVFADALDPAVTLELDVYWSAVAGVEPRALLERLGDRVGFLHVKDAPPLSDGSLDHDLDHQVPFGSGALDATGILHAAPADCTVVVEFDRFGGDVFEGIGAARTWLASRT